MRAEFQVGRHNAHYDGVYSAKEREWRRICAVDKAAHIRDILGASAADIGTVIDVGCGTGVVLGQLADLGVGRQFTGIDVIDPAVNLEIEPAGRETFSFGSYDGKTIPFPDRTFDLSYASHVLEHVPEPRAFLRELARTSRRFVYVEVPCELHARTGHAALQSTLDIGHINFYTPETFSLVLQTSGLQVAKLSVYDHSPAVHRFHTSRLRGDVKNAVRKALLAVSPDLATRVATYHCGALCTVP